MMHNFFFPPPLEREQVILENIYIPLKIRLVKWTLMEHYNLTQFCVQHLSNIVQIDYYAVFTKKLNFKGTANESSSDHQLPA